MIRSIPAFTGETTDTGCCAVGSGVYPRIHGGNSLIFSPRPAASGLSPHSRGKHARRGSWRVSTGSIPAFTGETPAAPQGSPVTEVYPRIHGGNPVQAGKFQQAGGLSPHSRGKRDCRCGEPDSGGSIPAFTGETLVTVTMAWRKGVYPRIHGGNGPVWD